MSHPWREGAALAALAGCLLLVWLVVGARPDRAPDPGGAAPSSEGPEGPVEPSETFTALPDPPPGPSAAQPGDGERDRHHRRARRLRDRIGKLGPSCQEVPPRRLVVATFNIHGGLGGGLRLETIAREIASMEADVVLLQEVDRGRKRTRLVDQAAWLGERLGMEAVYGANGAYQRPRPGVPRGRIGNAILSRWPIESHQNVHLPHRPGTDLRSLLRAQVDLDGVPVAVYNTHLEHTSAAARRAQARKILDLVGPDPLPQVLGGDLNAGPGRRALGILGQRFDDVWPAAGRGDPRTVRRTRIDYVLHSRDITARDAVVVRSTVSDHDAVRAVLEVPAPPECDRG